MHTVFLAFRLTLNLTNDNARNCALFSTAELIQYLLGSIHTSFEKLEASATEEQRAIDLDLLVLGMGIMINLAEHDSATRQHAISSTTAPTLTALLDTFQQGQNRIEDADTVEESTTNVAFGYLAVMLANICLDNEPREFVAKNLTGEGLSILQRPEARDSPTSISRLQCIQTRGEEIGQLSR